MSDSSGGAAPVPRTHDFLPSADVYWREGGGWTTEFAQGFKASANFGTAMVGFGINVITAGAAGRIKGTFG